MADPNPNPNPTDPTPPPADPNPNDPPPTDPTPPPADPNPNDPPPAPPKAKSLLDDDDPPPADPNPNDPPPAEPNAPTEEEMKAFRDGLSAFDLGDGVTWSDEAFKAYQPELMRLTGNDPKKAEALVKAHVGFIQAQQKAQDEAADAFNRGLIQECEKRFGQDLKKVAGLAKQGGRAVFGDKLWNEMKVIPAFANNPDIMEKLAEVGRKFATDGGKVTQKDGDGAVDKGDVFHRMYGNVKV